MWYHSWGQVTDFSRPNNSVTSSSMICWMNSCAFSLTIPSSVSHIGLLDALWGPAISSLFTHPLILAQGRGSWRLG